MAEVYVNLGGGGCVCVCVRVCVRELMGIDCTGLVPYMPPAFAAPSHRRWNPPAYCPRGWVS